MCSRLSEYALRRLNFSQRLDSITVQADRNALPPCFSRHFGPGPRIQLGRYGSHSQRHRRAIASKAPAGYGSQTTLARHTNLKVRSCRTFLWGPPASWSDAEDGRLMRADSAILQRLIHMTCWFAPLILRLGANQHLAHPGDIVFRHACAMGLEGIVSTSVSKLGI